MKSSLLVVALLFCAGATMAGGVHADVGSFDTSVKVKASALMDGDRDLGSADFHTARGGILEITPQAYLQITDDVSAFLRVRGFTQSNDFAPMPGDTAPTQANTFGEVRELWVDYGGLTDYPGEHLRIGRQRLRQDDGQWFDMDIESLRWIFDTTLIQADLGIAEAFDSYTYKKDAVALPQNLKDRFNAFAAGSYEWAPSQRVGIRALYADDDGKGNVAADSGGNSKPTNARLLWLGAHVENGFYDYHHIKPLTYWGEAIWLTGSEKPTTADIANGATNTVQKQDVRAWGGDLGVRVKPVDGLPLQIGAGYAFGSGSDTDKSDTYRQTGLNSNRSHFTGTRSLVARYSEVLRADLSNLSVTSLFTSLQFETGDASLVLHNFRRDNSSAPIITDGITVQPVPGNHDIGQGVDLVLSRYFGPEKNDTDPEGDAQTAVRLRVSLFDPGSGYASTAHQSAYRIILEGTVLF